MQPNTRDTPMRRCSTVVWGVALMLAVGIVGILLYPLFNKKGVEIDDQAQQHSKLPEQFQESHVKQAATLESFQYDIDKAAKSLKETISK